VSAIHESDIERPQIPIHKTPAFQVTITWIWNIVGVLLVGLIAIALLPPGYPLTNATLKSFPSLMPIPIIGEFLTTGFLPLLFAYVNKDQLSTYGITKKGLTRSVVISAFLSFVYLLVRFIITGNALDPEVNGLNVNVSTVVLSTLLVLFCGPLEVFFVFFLIDNTDRHFEGNGKQERGLITKGLIITILVYGLLHSMLQGPYSFVIAMYFLVLALIYRHTKNIIGPMIAWTIMNNSIWFFLGILVF